MDSKHSADELLPVVDENDEVIDLQPRHMVHQQGLRHRAVHVMVYNAEGQVYLQRRAWTKDSSPGKWDSSASGHVDPNEAYDDAAKRELEEELALTPERPMKAQFVIPACPQTGMEFTAVFTLETQGQPVPNPEEILEGQWMPPSEVTNWVKMSPESFAPCFVAVWTQLHPDNA